MSEQLVILAHGMGDAQPGFESEWTKVIKKNSDLSGVTIKGLVWEDILQKAADQYDFASGPLGELLDMAGFPKLKKWTDKDSWKTVKDSMMDVLIYVGLQDMWLLIQNRCLERIEELRGRGPGKSPFALEDTILVGHSLGAAMMQHLTWREYLQTGTIPYRGLIQMASPVGFESPKPGICKDFLQRMAEMAELKDNRIEVLSRYARAWRKLGRGRLKYIINENDIVCSDVTFPIPGTDKLIDLIPLRQGFDPNERNALNGENEECVQTISFGERDPKQIGANHNVLNYLEQPAFVKAFNKLLAL